MALVGYLNKETAQDALIDASRRNLNSTSTRISQSIHDFFSDRVTRLELESQSPAQVALLQNLTKAHAASGLPVSEFVKSYEWAGIFARGASQLRTFADTAGFYDAYLISLDQHVLLNLSRESDLGGRLSAGKGAETRLAQACTAALATGRPVVSDFERYGPSDGLLSVFLVQVMVDRDGDRIGLMALQLDVAHVAEIVQDRTGLGDSGQSYLVGADLRLRAAARPEQQKWVLDRTVETEPTRAWQAALLAEEVWQAPAQTYAGPAGDMVLGRLDTLDAFGLTLGIITEIDRAEVTAPIERLGQLVLGVVIGTALLVLLIALGLTYRLVRPIGQLAAWGREVAVGNLAQVNIKPRSDEIGEVLESFQSIVASYRQLTDVPLPAGRPARVDPRSWPPDRQRRRHRAASRSTTGTGSFRASRRCWSSKTTPAFPRWLWRRPERVATSV